ncbi:MAG: D-tyrosyl-tRNA(Tyr) deacylase [Methanomicrobiales archaeon]|jgi:D-aminoacyl-tRNA deacylase|nr:D-tyrosyl-tRNA(Tyr) deacylase [Methanomicrobiales archaeon]
MTSKQLMQTTLLISSRKDPAGSLIHEELCKLLEKDDFATPFIRHLHASERLIYLDGPSLPNDADRIIFLSRHASERPRPVLTVHVTGNFGTADYGGEPGTLTAAATNLMHALLNRLFIHAPEGYEVMYEATHHGPTSLLLPSCFIELGSTETEWNDRNAAGAVARAVLDAISMDISDVIPMAGFGGTHYAQRQTEISRLTRGGFGHIMPTRDIPHLDGEMFQKIISLSGAKAVYIDGKSMSGKEERMIAGLAGQKGVPVLGQGDLVQMKNLSFHDYMAIRSLADSLVNGSSVVIHNLEIIDSPASISIPGGLVDEVMKVASEEFFSALDPLPVAHLTGRGRACHPVFITNASFSAKITDELIHLCVILLQDRYTCSFDGDFLIISKSRFDPARAKSFGIPPGPLYSELMAGKPVKSGDLLVYPEMVMTETEKRIYVPQRQAR